MDIQKYFVMFSTIVWSEQNSAIATGLVGFVPSSRYWVAARKQPSCVGHSFQDFAGPYLVSPVLMLGLALSGTGPLLDVRQWVLGS